MTARRPAGEPPDHPPEPPSPRSRTSERPSLADDIQDLLASVLRDNADAILVVADGVVVAANPAASRLLGREAAALIGADFGLPVAVDGVTEVDLVRDGPPRVAEMHVNRTTLGGRPVHVATMRDVTERRRAEQSLRDFVSVASHELRTPLATIKGFAEMMMARGGQHGPDDVVQFADVIERQTSRLLRLTTDLLRVSRLDDQSLPVRADLLPVAEVVVGALQAGGISDDVDAEVDGDLVVWADHDHVEEALINLANNAVRHGAPPVTVSAHQRNGQVVIEVRDQGVGVPEDFVHRLFDRFARADREGRRGEGTGLGLAITAQIAEANRGRVWYRPNDPQGAVFSLVLPASEPDGQRAGAG